MTEQTDSGFAHARYSVKLWDHEGPDPENPGGPGCWSGTLARTHLGGPNEGLSWRGIGQAIRRLYARGWSEVSICVWREDEGGDLAEATREAKSCK